MCATGQGISRANHHRVMHTFMPRRTEMEQTFAQKPRLYCVMRLRLFIMRVVIARAILSPPPPPPPRSTHKRIERLSAPRHRIRLGVKMTMFCCSSLPPPSALSLSASCCCCLRLFASGRRRHACARHIKPGHKAYCTLLCAYHV